MIVKVIGEHTLSKKEIQALTGLSDYKNFFYTYMKRALDSGFIVPIYPDKSRHPNQKYRLTEKGRKLFETLNKLVKQ